MSRILSPSDISGLSPAYTCCLLGDSITNQNNYRLSVGSISRKDGVATVVTTASHELWPGAEFSIMPAMENWGFGGKHTVSRYLSSTSFEFAISPDFPSVGPATSVTLRHHGHQSDQGWFHWFNSRLHGRFEMLNNGAITGGQAEDLLRRVETDVIPYNPTFCFVLLGTNDALQSVPLAQTTGALEGIYRRLIEAGTIVVALTVPPLGSGSSSFTKCSPRVRAINHWIREYAAKTPRVILVDTYAALVDSTSTTGAHATSVLGGDGVHPTALGAKVMGDAIYDVLSDLIPPSRTGHVCPFDAHGISATTVTLSRTANLVTATASGHGFAKGDEVLITGATPSNMNGLYTILSTTSSTFTYHAPGSDGSGSGTIKASTSRNMYDYGLFHVTTGGDTNSLSGTAATGIELHQISVGTGVGSVVAAPTVWHPDGISVGNAQRVVYTSADSTDSVRITSPTTELNNRLISGRSYYLEGYVSFTNVAGSNLEGFIFVLSFTVDGIVYNLYAHRRSLTTYPTSDFWMYMRSSIVKIPKGTISSPFWRLSPEFSGAGTALTIDVGRVRVVRVD
jgi:lysophospholipase L1-like esterase